MTNLITSLNRLSAEELLVRVKDLARREREATVTVIAHLAEVDTRRLFLPEGCSSMFIYCTRILCFSERAAYARIKAARTSRKFPEILDRLAEGSLNLTSVVLLAPHLTRDNHRDVIDEAGGKTRRQVEEIVARLRPLPPVPSSIRKLPISKQPDVAPADSLNLDPLAPAPVDNQAAPTSAVPSGSVATPPTASPACISEPEQETRPSHRAVILPLAPEYYRLQVTLRAETHERLRQAQELLRHTIPSGDPAEILDRALADLVEKLSRRKFAALTRPRLARKEIAASPRSG